MHMFINKTRIDIFGWMPPRDPLNTSLGYIFNDDHSLKCLGELPDPFNGIRPDQVEIMLV